MAPELFIRIEDYLDNTLSPAERLAFESEMRADPELAQTVALVREARDRLVRQWASEPADAALMETLREIGKEHFKGEALATTTPPKSHRVVFFQRVVWAAAAVLVLLTAAWLFFLRPPYHERLYAQYKHLPEASFTVRSVDNGSAAAEAAEAFNNKNYDKALALLEQHLHQAPDDAEARYFTGLCLLEMRRFEEARAAFAQIENTPAWMEEARWYIALTYLRENRLDDCRLQLERIPSESPHYERAQQLLKAVAP